VPSPGPKQKIQRRKRKEGAGLLGKDYMKKRRGLHKQKPEPRQARYHETKIGGTRKTNIVLTQGPTGSDRKRGKKVKNGKEVGKAHAALCSRKNGRTEEDRSIAGDEESGKEKKLEKMIHPGRADEGMRKKGGWERKNEKRPYHKEKHLTKTRGEKKHSPKT